jgi:hypothetical protein
MRRILGVAVMALALVATACTEKDSGPVPAGSTSPTPRAAHRMTPAKAREVLAALTAPDGGSFDGGTFYVGRPIPGPTTVSEGRLASTSWDFYYLLDTGKRGSWGAAVKIFRTPAQATRAADAFAVFWGCDGARTVVGDIDATAYDDLMATYCKRAGGTDYLATVSAVDGRVTSNLTVAATTPELAVAELTAAWKSLTEASQQAASAVA